MSDEEENSHSSDAGPSQQQSLSPDLIKSLKKAVVNVEKNVTYSLNHNKTGSFVGTGFVVDAKRGLVATNAHIAGVSPCQVHITFENGERCGARILYVDAWHDFAFYQLNMDEVDWPLCEAKLGDSFSLVEQQPVALIGNNDGEEYSIKFGVVTNLSLNRGEFHSGAYQTSFDRTGGSSGSPVFDSDGNVVGIHMRGTDTTSIELRIEYIIDSLSQLKDPSHAVKRGMIGVELDLLTLSKSRTHFEFPSEHVEQLKSTFQDIKHCLVVERTIPNSKVEEILRPGDIIWKLNDQLIGNNIYLFDKIVDQCTGSTVNLVIYRYGIEKQFTIEVEDAEAKKVRKFALFAGGVFHDLTPSLRSKFIITGNGVFLGQAANGCCLSDLGAGGTKNPTSYVTVVEEICGIPTKNLDEFIEVIKKIGNKKHIYILARNFRSFSSALLAHLVTLDTKFEPLRVFHWNYEKLDWDQNSSCNNTQADAGGN